MLGKFLTNLLKIAEQKGVNKRKASYNILFKQKDNFNKIAHFLY
jgi:hypothetical protein